MDEVQVRHRFVAADGGHAALVPVPKPLRWSALENGLDVVRGVPPLLHGHWRNAWQRFPGLIRKIREIADDENFRMSRNREVVVNENAPYAVDRDAKSLADKGRRVTCRPDFDPARNEFVTDLQAGIGEIGRVHASSQLHAEISELFRRTDSEIFREGGQGRAALLQSG